MNEEFTISITTTPLVVIVLLVLLVVVDVLIRKFLIDLRINSLLKQARKQINNSEE